MADGGATAPGTLDRRRWQRDTSGYPAEPCVTADCDRPRVALGYCDACAAAALANRGVLRRRLRALLVVLATDEPLDTLAAWKSWKATLANAAADCWHVLEDPGVEDQPVPVSAPSGSVEKPEAASDRCSGCGLRLYAWEQARGTCAACNRTQDVA